MHKEQIKSMLKTIESANGVTVIENDSSYNLNVIKGKIFINVTIPVDVTELFFEAYENENEKPLKDWRDFYGDTENEDFTEDLSILISAIRDSEFRFSNNKKTIEYYKNKWCYAFGYFGIDKNS